MIAAEASAVVVADVGNPGHRNRAGAWTVIAVDAGTDTEGAGVVGESGAFGGRRRELRPRSNWTDSNHAGGVGKWEKRTQREQMWSPKRWEGPEQKRGRQRQESGRKSLDP